MSNESLLEQLGLSPDPVFPASVKGKVDFSNQFSNLLPSNPTGIAPVISPVIDSTAYSGLEGVAPSVPNVTRSFGVSTPASEVTTNVGGVEVTGNKEIVDNVKKYAETTDSDELFPLLTALAAAGLISSLTSPGSAKIEVSGQSETPAQKPAEPPPAPPAPPPVIPAPVTPSTTDTPPTTDTSKQEPTAEEKSLAEKLGIPAATLATLLKYGLGALASYLSYKSAKDAQEQARGASFTSRGPVTSTRTTYGGSTYKPAAQGGLMALAGGGEISQPFYLGGPTDGMADEVPAYIDNKRPAALSDGEFVIPADVVSHLGNGNSNAGAKRLYEMMDNIREARTGNKNQGIQINPNQFMPR